MPIESAEFHCWYSADPEAARQKGRLLLQKFGPFLKGRVVDLGCGEGAFLLVLMEHGNQDVLGIESNSELVRLAESFRVPVIQRDLLQFFREEKVDIATFLYVDVMEHVPFDYNIELLRIIPVGSRLIIQTPNTESLLGHQFYLNVPSHLAPYSPVVIRRMLARFGFDIVSEGSVDGRHPDTWIRKIRSIFIRRVLGVPPEMFTGGGNYFVVADRNREEGENPSG